jgi:UDP-glucose 4-epimerase
MPKSLVTGGAGFIGSHVIDVLIEKGHDIVIIDNLSTGDKNNIHPKAKFYEIDIRDPKLSEIFTAEKPDYVFHMAAQIDVRKSVAEPIMDAEINILGSLNVLENAAQSGVKKVVFASTGGAIYGEAEIFPTPEGHYEKPLSPYGIHKLAVEKSLFFYKKVKYLDYTILRLSNVYGPRQNSRGEAGVIAIFIDKLLRGEQPVINGSGEQTRDYVFVKDVAIAFVLALENDSEFDKFNISTGVETDVNQIFDKIVSAMKIDTSRKHEAAKGGEQQRSCLDNRLAIDALKWKPEYDIDRGIIETVEWFMNDQKSDNKE